MENRVDLRGGALVLVAALLAPGHAAAGNYDEATNGDLAGDGFAPTVLALDAGSNTLRGTFGSSPVPGVADLDYVAVVVPDGYRVSSLVLLNLFAGGANSFLGVQSGPQMTLLPTSYDPSPLLGWNHIYTNQQGTDLLPALGINGGLGAGSYTFWINETDISAQFSYAMNFQVSAVPVPEPATWMLTAAGLATLRRRVKAMLCTNA